MDKFFINFGMVMGVFLIDWVDGEGEGEEEMVLSFCLMDVSFEGWDGKEGRC